MMISMVRNIATTGDLTALIAMFGGGGGRGPAGFGPPPAWNARPGEGAPSGGGRGGAPGGGLDANAFQQQLALFAIPGRPVATGGFAGLSFLQTLGFPLNFGGGGGSDVAPGDYLVSITVGGKTYKQRVRVERALPGAVMR